MEVWSEKDPVPQSSNGGGEAVVTYILLLMR